MLKYRVLIAMGLALSCALAPSASASVEFDRALGEADAVRTSDPVKFNRLVDELNQSADSATAAERRHLRLLNAYRDMVKGEAEHGIRELRALLDDDEVMDVDFRVRTGALLVNGYALTRNFTQGLRELERALALVDKVQDRDIRHQALLAATVLYNQVGQYELGERYAGQVLDDKPGGRYQCMGGNLRLEALQGLGKALADEAYLEAARRCQAIGEPIATNLVRSYLARKWFAAGRVDEAIGLLEAHLDEVRATGYRYLIGEFNALLSKFQLAKGNLAKAEHHARVVIDHKRGGLPTTLPLVTAYHTLYSVAEAEGDIPSAFAYFKEYAGADKAYLDEVNVRETAYRIVQREAREQAQQIELLNRQNQVLTLQQSVSEQKAQTQRLLILLLVVLVGSVGYWAFKIKRVQMSLRRMAETDALTSLCNRHHFTQQSAQTLSQAARAGEDVALVMFDLDHFKSINDRFGHDTGDWVLKQVAEHCRTFCRRVDHLGRIGGEEFAILLLGCDLRGARRVAEDCRVRIASIDSQPSGHRFLITASFGVTASSLSGYDLAKLLSHADKALYRSKREGRNRVSAFDGNVQMGVQLQVVAVDDRRPGQAPAPEVASDRAVRSQGS